MIHRVCVLAMCLLSVAVVAWAGDWPAWRGPDGAGVSTEKGLPVHWTTKENVKWNTPLPAPGNSTPVVTGSRVFVTLATDEGHRRRLWCLDRSTGQKLWERTVEYAEDEPTHAGNPYCSASPVTDGERVVVSFGSAGVYAFDLDGQSLWHVDLGKFEHIWGNAASPVIYGDRVFLNCGPGLRAFVVALDKRTGREVWRREMPDEVSQKIDEFRGSWSTPVVYRYGDRDMLLLSLPKRLYALDPLTGETIWSCDGLGDLVYTSPLPAGDTVVAMSGYHGPALAVRCDGRGDVTETHRRWWLVDQQQNLQRVGSGVIVEGYIYILNEPGIAWCMSLEDGSVQWKQRLGSTNSWSSMSYADGRLYVMNMQGTTFVLAANPMECQILGENPLDEKTCSSLAFSDGQIFVRTYERLYCIEQSPPASRDTTK